MRTINENIVGGLMEMAAGFFPDTRRLIIPVLVFLLYASVEAQNETYDTLLVASRDAGSAELELLQDDNTIQNKKEPAFFPALFQRENLSGEWWGFRNILRNSGFEFDLIYKGESFTNTSGGIAKGTAALDNIDIIFGSDLEKIVGLRNTGIVIQFLGNSGGSPCELVGAAQGISNIETVPTWKLYQFLIESRFFESRLSISAGLYDLNSEFDTRESSSIFINPSHGIGAEFALSGLNGPSIFPTTSIALRIKYESDNGKYFQTAMMDGVPGDPENPYGTRLLLNKEDGLLLTAEFGTVTTTDDLLESKFALGAWTYTAGFSKNFIENPGEDHSLMEKNYGFYLTSEKLLISYPENSVKNLYGFLRVGYANKNINPVDLYAGAGLKFTGFISGRDKDELGLALAFAHNSSAFRNSAEIGEGISIKPYELNIEATYLFRLTPWLIIQPDIQYILNPAYCSQSGSAFVVGSRMQLIF